MPIIAYQCSEGHVDKKFYRQVSQAPACVVCKDCKKEAKKILSAPSSLSKIVVDNGVQARAVEIIPNIIELNQEKAKKDYRED